MWIIDTKGTARNISMAHKIEIIERYGKSTVFATFPLKGDKTSNDPAFYEMAILASYDNYEDATAFMNEIVNKLNRVEDSLNTIAEILNMRM